MKAARCIGVWVNLNCSKLARRYYFRYGLWPLFIFCFYILLPYRQILKMTIYYAILSVRGCCCVPYMPIYPYRIVLPSARHGISMHINPEAHPLVAVDALQDVFRFDIPQNNVAIFAGSGNKRRTIESAKAASDSKTLVSMPLIRLLDASLYIVPQTDAVIQVESENKAAIW